MGEHGAGTIVTLPNGRLRVAVTMADGRRVWRRARSPREAERIRKQLVEARELDLDPTRQTLAEYLRSWTSALRAARNQRVRPRTLDHYELIVETHIIPALGKLKLSQVTGRKVQAWLDADPAAPRTVRHHHAVLRRALNIAVKQHLLAYNPANTVELPDADDDRSDPLTIDEAKRLLAAAEADPTQDPPRKADRLAVLWRLALVTGLRQGELLGLVWDDVAGDRITVAHQLQRLDPSEGGDENGWARTSPKAARSVETITIDAETAAALERHRLRQAGERQEGWRYFGMVFVTARGNPYHGSEVLKAFRLALARAGLRERRFHDLRHTAATMMRGEGVAEDTRMARLGHSTTAMSRKYAKASDVQDRDAADRMGRALGATS